MLIHKTIMNIKDKFSTNKNIHILSGNDTKVLNKGKNSLLEPMSPAEHRKSVSISSRNSWGDSKESGNFAIDDGKSVEKQKDK